MEIKGTAVKAINAYVYDNYRERYEEWFNSLSQHSRHIMSTAFNNDWYPIEEGAIEPTSKIGELIFSGDLKQGAFQSGKYSAIVGLHGIYKLFVRFSAPGHVMDRGPRILAAYYRPSTFIMLERSKQHVIFEIADCEGINSIIEYRMAGWVYKALELSGCNTLHVELVESFELDGRTVFSCNWT